MAADTLSNRIKDEMKAQGRQKKWLASQFGVSYGTIQNKMLLDSWTNADKALIEKILGVK